MADFRFPNITATTDSEKLKQLETYLFQLTNQLNYAIKTTEAQEEYIQTASKNNGNGEQEISTEEKIKQDIFYNLRDFIVNSADIVNAFSEEVTSRLSGLYVAKSEFGDYVEKEDVEYKQTSRYASAAYTKSEAIGNVIDVENGTMDDITMYRNNKFYIKTGWLDVVDSKQVGGIELGQMTDDGASTTVKFARFTPEKLSFYNKQGIELAYFSGLDLVITDAIIKGNLSFEDCYRLDSSDGLAFKWIGGDD